MEAADVSEDRLRTARQCLEAVCNEYYLKAGLSDDDIVLMNMSEIVSEAFDHVCYSKPFSFDRLHETCDNSSQQTQLEKFAYALSTLLQLLLSGWNGQLPEATSTEEMEPLTSILISGPNGEMKTEDSSLFDNECELQLEEPITDDIKEEILEDDEIADEAVAGPSHTSPPVDAPQNAKRRKTMMIASRIQRKVRYRCAFCYFEADNRSNFMHHSEAGFCAQCNKVYTECKRKEHTHPKEELEEDEEEALVQPEISPIDTTPVTLWVKSKPGMRPPLEPIKCRYCDVFATPGNEMGYHMSSCHADIVPVLRQKFAKEEALRHTYRYYPRPAPQAVGPEAKEMREKYAAYSTRYLPKNPRPRKNAPNHPSNYSINELEPNVPIEERGRKDTKYEEIKKKANRPCSICRAPIAQSKLRDEHLRRDHPEQWLKLKKCDHPACDYRSCIPAFMQNHAKTYTAQHTKMGEFGFPPDASCPHCGKRLATLADYIKHMADLHSFQLLSKELIFRCGSCSFRFSRLFALANHWVHDSCIPKIRLDAGAMNKSASEYHPIIRR